MDKTSLGAVFVVAIFLASVFYVVFPQSHQSNIILSTPQTVTTVTKTVAKTTILTARTSSEIFYQSDYISGKGVVQLQPYQWFRLWLSPNSDLKVVSKGSTPNGTSGRYDNFGSGSSCWVPTNYAQDIFLVLDSSSTLPIEISSKSPSSQFYVKQSFAKHLSTSMRFDDYGQSFNYKEDPRIIDVANNNPYDATVTWSAYGYFKTVWECSAIGFGSGSSR